MKGYRMKGKEKMRFAVIIILLVVLGLIASLKAATVDYDSFKDAVPEGCCVGIIIPEVKEFLDYKRT